MNEFQEQLDRAYPASADLAIVTAVSEGITLADASMTTSKLLSGSFGADLRGHIRRAGIQTAIHEAAQAGKLPFSSTLQRMPTGGWHWIELVGGSVKAHVHRTEGPTLFPPETPTRQSERYSNQEDLFVSVDAGREVAFRCAWLMFGLQDSGKLNHLCWGMPAAERDVWLARSNILRRLADTYVPVERASPQTKLVLRFRDQVETMVTEAVKDGRVA